MEVPRMKIFVFACALAGLTATGSSCGPSFEEAPPTLDITLDALPHKTLEEIFSETSPKPSKPEVPWIGPRIKEISESAKKEPAGPLIAEVDRLIASVREAGGDHEQLAQLHDLRDALNLDPKQCSEYLAWRVEHTPVIKPVFESDSGYPPPPAPVPPVDLMGEIGTHAAENSSMQPHWIYILGAVYFNYRDKVEAQKWFDKVVRDFPNSPRAEMALFMSGRCLLAQSRQEISYYNQSNEEIERIQSLAKAKKAEAAARFHEYLAKYPNGRFVADAYGWLGALESGVIALDDYIRQVETPGHPEVLDSGIEMIQAQLESIAPEEEKAATGLVAKHPRVAMALLYVLLGDRWEDSSNASSTESPASRQKKWRNLILPHLAQAVAEQKNLYTGSDVWKPRYLAILTHAASNSGDQVTALKLTDIDPQSLEMSDDLLLARAIALQRAGKASEAIAAYQNFLSRFSDSPMASGVRVRYGIALRDNKQAGHAVIELQKFLKQNDPSTGYFFVPPDQVKQMVDAMLNFAPLPELASVLENKEADPDGFSQLKAIIAARAVSHEDFANARKFMAPAEFDLAVAEIERLTSQVKNAPSNKEKAELEARLGDAWAAHRGTLLSLKGLPADFHDEPEMAEVNRRANGKALGFHDVESELDERDEMHHASRWWLRAAHHAPATSLSAACRLKALEAMAKVAAQSDYAFERAMEEELGKASREIYSKLQTESPGSPEAKRAAYWSFSSPKKGGNDSTDKYGFSGNFFSDRWWKADMRRKSGYYWPDFGLSGEEIDDENDYGDSKAWAPIGTRINALKNSTKSISELATEVGDLKAFARTHFSSVGEAAILNFLEDLVLFLNEPNLNQEIAHRYINLRLEVLFASSWHSTPFVPDVEWAGSGGDDFTGINERIREKISDALKDNSMKPIFDYLEFLDAAMVANSRVSIPSPGKKSDKDDESYYSSRDYPLVEKMLRTFLQAYPHSKKREAARLLLARAVYRQSWPRILTEQSQCAEPKIELIQWESLKPKRVLAELDAYDREFPQGRYSPEIRDMRASVCWRSADWKPALDLTLRQLDEKLPDLRRDAVLRLANIFAELASPEHRPGLMAAIRESPSAEAWLKVYLAQAPNYRDNPLRFLGVFLQEQIGFKIEGNS